MSGELLREALAKALVGPARDWQERHRQGSFVTTPEEFVNALMAAALPVVLHYGRETTAEELRRAAEELHVARFNADPEPEARWPHGTPQVAPDTFYRGITVAELALKYRAVALTRDLT